MVISFGLFLKYCQKINIDIIVDLSSAWKEVSAEVKRNILFQSMQTEYEQMNKLQDKIQEKLQSKVLALTLGVLLVVSMVYVGRETVFYATGKNVNVGEMCVVLDAGHGGEDPGKIGINGANEKDINLRIALLVKKYLEAAGVKVVMTREEDTGLNDPNASNKKVQDMKRRIALIDEVSPQVTVSIHQNSYPEEYVHGAQVFYYDGSVQGKRLAERIQAQLIEKVDPDNKRQIKGNNSYYLLKKTEIPIVIVECGFLSNSAEAELLCDPDYQDRVAWAIHMGILQYLNQ